MNWPPFIVAVAPNGARKTKADAISHGATTRILRGLLAGLHWQEMSSLDEPQGVVFRVTGSQVVRLLTEQHDDLADLDRFRHGLDAFDTARREWGLLGLGIGIDPDQHLLALLDRLDPGGVRRDPAGRRRRDALPRR